MSKIFSDSVNKKNKYNGCNVTGNENGLAPVAVASSAKLSGKLPVSLGTPFKANGGDVSQLSIEGSDVDLYIDTPRALTIIEAESLGGDQWEVVHLDDPNRIFSFNDGDIVRGDAIRNPLIKLALSTKSVGSSKNAFSSFAGLILLDAIFSSFARESGVAKTLGISENQKQPEMYKSLNGFAYKLKEFLLDYIPQLNARWVAQKKNNKGEMPNDVTILKYTLVILVSFFNYNGQFSGKGDLTSYDLDPMQDAKSVLNKLADVYNNQVVDYIWKECIDRLPDSPALKAGWNDYNYKKYLECQKTWESFLSKLCTSYSDDAFNQCDFAITSDDILEPSGKDLDGFIHLGRLAYLRDPVWVKRG